MTDFEMLLNAYSDLTRQSIRLEDRLLNLQDELHALYDKREQPGSDLSRQLQEMLGHIAGGRKLNAIKIYRELTGKGLRECKEAIETLMPRY